MDRYQHFSYAIPADKKVTAVNIIPPNWEVQQPLALHAANGMYDAGKVIRGTIKKFEAMKESEVQQRQTYTGRVITPEEIEERIALGHVPEIICFQNYPSGIVLLDKIKEQFLQGYRATINAELDVGEYPEEIEVTTTMIPRVIMRLREYETIEHLTQKAQELGLIRQ